MVLLASWPTTTDDSGTKTDGTMANAALFDAIKASVEDQVHSATNTLVKPKTITDEVIQARGSAASLDARLDVSLNEDGTFRVGVVRRLYSTAVQGASVGAGETTLASYSIPASTLDANDEGIRVTAYGSFAANANAKTIRFKFGGTTFTMTSTAINAGAWHFTALITRTGAATQVGGAFIAVDTGPLNNTEISTALAETLSGAVVVLISGQATTNSDILLNLFTVEHLG